jgi:hypothetical protein
VGLATRVSLTHIAGTSFPDDGPGHEQADSAVDSPAIPGDLCIGVLCPDLVAKETRRLAGGVRDQSLGFGQFQLEFIMQEPLNPRLDFLGLALGTGELCVPRIPSMALTSTVALPAVWP